MIAVVHHSNEEAFLHDLQDVLERDSPPGTVPIHPSMCNIVDKTVRVSVQMTKGEQAIYYRVVATALQHTVGDNVLLLRFHAFIGECMETDPKDSAVAKKTDERADALRGKLKKLGLTVKPGVIQAGASN